MTNVLFYLITCLIISGGMLSLVVTCFGERVYYDKEEEGK